MACDEDIKLSEKPEYADSLSLGSFNTSNEDQVGTAALTPGDVGESKSRIHSFISDKNADSSKSADTVPQSVRQNPLPVGLHCCRQSVDRVSCAPVRVVRVVLLPAGRLSHHSCTRAGSVDSRLRLLALTLLAGTGQCLTAYCQRPLPSCHAGARRGWTR